MHKQKVTTLGWRKLHFPKVAKIGHIFGHRIDYLRLLFLEPEAHEAEGRMGY